MAKNKDNCIIIDSINEKVIPQLESSLYPSFMSVEIHFEGEYNDSFEIYPFPLPPINRKGSAVIYLRDKKRCPSVFSKGILISGMYEKETIEIPIEKVENEDEKFGNSILSLFAFNYLKAIENKRYLSNEEIQKVVEISISSGVLCKYTGYVGASNLMIRHMHYDVIGCISDRPDMMLQVPTCCNSCVFEREYDDDECFWDKSQCDILEHPEKHRGVFNDDDDKQQSSVNALYNSSLKFDLLSITNYQNVDGFWEDLQAANNMLGINVKSINGIKMVNKDDENKCIATVLAVAAIRVKQPNEKNSWLMTEKKAIDWLKKELLGTDIEQIIAKTEKLF